MGGPPKYGTSLVRVLRLIPGLLAYAFIASAVSLNPWWLVFVGVMLVLGLIAGTYEQRIGDGRMAQILLVAPALAVLIILAGLVWLGQPWFLLLAAMFVLSYAAIRIARHDG
jgi:hypothetical protein